MKLYSIALPADLSLATSKKFRQRFSEALDQYAALTASRISPAFRDGIERTTTTVADSPAARAWAHTVNCLAHPQAKQQAVPYSSLVGHLDADGPTVGRIFELLGWEALGAASNVEDSSSFELPSAPPNLLSIKEWGAFNVGERWPAPAKWKLSFAASLACLEGPQFCATSAAAEPAWMSNVHISGAGIDAYIPLTNSALVNRDFQEFPMVRSRAYAAEWASVVRHAAEVINRYNRSAAACVEAFTRCVVPLVGGDDTIGSASREEALGLVFLPASSCIDQVTECLLHETMHQYLFRIEECGDLFTPETEKDERFYSPWRSDPRPLRMTLHGAFVFLAVADLYLWESAPSMFGIDDGECTRRAYQRARQVRIALEVVHRNARLTRFGSAVMDAIEHDLTSILDRTCPTVDDRATIDALLMAHSERYAAYAR